MSISASPPLDGTRGGADDVGGRAAGFHGVMEFADLLIEQPAVCSPAIAASARSAPHSAVTAPPASWRWPRVLEDCPPARSARGRAPVRSPGEGHAGRA